MFDFLSRSLRYPLDYLRTLSWHKVALVRTEDHGEGVHSFIFQKPARLRWKAGQHGVWWFLGEKLAGGNWRAFSIASSAHENELRISTRISAEPSAFKQRLKAMQPGETIWLQGPFGEFYTNDKPQVLGIAGGIGITPFRAITYEIAHGLQNQTDLRLLYSAQSSHPFKAELDAWMSKTKRLSITYIHTPEELEALLHVCYTDHGTAIPALISGSPGMIDAVSRSCYEKGATTVISDPFKGY